MLWYYFLLRKILHNNSYLRKCLTKCLHCGIFFLTHIRNKGRNDIRCPFGCRQTHRRKSSTKRSADYYSTDWGKDKKKIHNEKWKQKKIAGIKIVSMKEQKIIPDETVFNYICILVSMIERRRISSHEILVMLKKMLREHSIKKKKNDSDCNKTRGP